MKKILYFTLVAVLAMTGCKNNKDEPLPGDWPPMAWRNVDLLVSEGESYIINENGGSFTFECTNYPSMWLSALILIDGEYQMITDEERKSFKGEWFEIKLQGNKLFIIVDPLPSSTLPRSFGFFVTVGDTGAGFTFRQQ